MHVNELFQPNLDEGFKDPGIFKAIFMIGPPGAGKNMIIDSLGLTAAGLRLQDVDSTLAYLNRAKMSAGKLKHDTAGYAHSLQTTRRRQTVLQQSMLGLIINTTGRDYESVINLKKELESVGYSTFMLHVHVTKKRAWKRATNRAKFATDPRDTRTVDRPYFNEAYRAIQENLPFYATMFGDRFAMIDNTMNRTERELVKHMSTRGPEAHMPSYVAQARSAANKVRRFLALPLSPLAQQAVDNAKRERGLE